MNRIFKYYLDSLPDDSVPFLEATKSKIREPKGESNLQPDANKNFYSKIKLTHIYNL